MTVNDKELLRISGFPAGINNVEREDSLPRNEDGIATALRQAVNVDITNAGKIQRRRGWRKVLSLVDAHSGFGGWPDAMLLVSAGELRAVTGPGPDNLTATALRAGMGQEVSYAPVNDDCYYTDGLVLRRVTPGLVDAIAAVTCPAQPTCTASATGGLPAGDYQVAVTNLVDGFESGSSLATLVTVEQGGGILLTDLTHDPDATHIRVYLTGADGDVLYWARDIPAGASQWLIGAGVRGKVLETQFLYPLPAGHLLRELNGRLYSCRDNVVQWSETMRYGLTRGDNYLRIGTRICLFEPVGRGANAGIYASGGKRTIWLPGADPKQWQQLVVRSTSAVPGTGCSVPAAWFNLEGVQGDVAFWVDSEGVMCLGLPGGQIMPVTEGRVAMPVNALRGAVLLQQRSGVRQVIAALLGGGANMLAASDSAVATIRKHGEAENL